jgi:hypothetical protein
MNKVTLLTKSRRPVFLPEGYPKTVRPSYLKYTAYNALSQTASSALGVLSTQQLLLGLGLNSLGTSAALNWIVKDGLGQLGGIAFTSLVGVRFDANARYYRLVSSLSLNLSCALEFVSPMAPGWFLPIAALATTGKNVSCLAGSASKAAIHQHFALENNLADVTAKTGNQNTLTSLIGMAIGTSLAYSLQPWVGPLFCGLSAVHMVTCYKAVKLVDFNTLNLGRAQMLVEEYVKTGGVLSPQDVASREHLLSVAGKEGVVIGAPASLREIPVGYSKPYLILREEPWVYLALEENCSDDQALTGLVEALLAYLQPACPPDPATVVSALTSAGWQLHLNHLDLGSVRYFYSHTKTS